MSAINPKRECLRRVHAPAVMVIGCLVAIASGATLAATADVPSITVKYGDLNLSTDEGAQRLYGRIAQAARTVCAEQLPRNLKAVAVSRVCEAEAIARAVSDVQSPRLAATLAARASRG